MIYQSPFEPVAEWSKDGLFDFLFTNNPKTNNSDSAALIDAFTNETISYRELQSRSLKFGQGLAAHGLGKKSTILIFSPNSLLYPVLLFGGVAAGVCVSTANGSYTPSELAHSIRLSGASVILVHNDLIAVALEAVALVEGVTANDIYLLPNEQGITHSGHKSWTELNGNGDGTFKAVKFTPNELKSAIAFLPFSSGTTGPGKGVEVSHFNVTSAGLQLSKVGIFSEKEIVMGVLPLYHIYGLIVLLNATIYNGGTVVLMPKFELPTFCASVQKYKATASYIVPPIALGLAKHPMVDDYDLSSLKFLMVGAAPLSAALQLTLEKRLKGKTAVLQGYGMTETTSVALLPLLADNLAGSCGKLLTSMEARLVDESGKDVGVGEIGELWIRGPNIMVGYHLNEKSTRETVNEDGWMMTGDICSRSADGYFTVQERLKELIKYSGFQVAPAELEALLLECPMVADAAVIGVWYEDRATELPRAYVVPEANFANEKDLDKKIIDWIAARVAPHKKLRGGVRLVAVIPKSPSGKILRKDLRVEAAKELAASGTAKL